MKYKWSGVPKLGNNRQTSTCFKVETVDTLEPNSPGARMTRTYTFSLFPVVGVWVFCASIFVYLLWRQLAISWNLTENTSIAFRHGLQNIPRTSGRVRVGNVWDDFSRSPPGIKGADSPSSSGLPVSPGGGASWRSSAGERSQELARKSVFDNATSHSTAFLLNSIHQSFWRCRFYTTQSEPMPGIHGRLTCFKRRLMRDVIPRVVNMRLFLTCWFDYRSRSTFTDEHEGWDDYFILRFCFAIKVIHIQVLLLEAPWALIVNIIAII